ALILIGFVVALTTACVMGAAYWALSNEFEVKARDDIEVNLRTLTLIFSKTFAYQVEMKGDKVVRVEGLGIPTFYDNDLVDRAISLIGGHATVFEYKSDRDNFVYLITTVKKDNGERAVGTELPRDHPAQAHIRRGEPYKGPAVLFDHKYYTAYQPILDS